MPGGSLCDDEESYWSDFQREKRRADQAERERETWRQMALSFARAVDPGVYTQARVEYDFKRKLAAMPAGPAAGGLAPTLGNPQPSEDRPNRVPSMDGHLTLGGMNSAELGNALARVRRKDKPAGNEEPSQEGSK